MMKNDFVCLGKGTKVLLSNMSTKNIEDICIGDLILNYDTINNVIESSKVEKILASFHDIANRIIFSNGAEIICTGDHPIYVTEKGWCSSKPSQTNENYKISVGLLNLGDKCLYFNGNECVEVSIIDIQDYFIESEMYVVSGGENHSFFANGFVVSDENILNIEQRLLTSSTNKY